MSGQAPQEQPVIGVELHRASVDAIADAVVVRLMENGMAVSLSKLLTARQLAATLGRSAAWVRSHSHDLGAIRVGDGQKPRLLFDLEIARERLASRSAHGQSEAPPRPRNKRDPRRSARAPFGTSVELLPVRPGPGSSPNPGIAEKHKPKEES